MAKAKSTKHEYKSAERSKEKIQQKAGETDIEYYTRLAKMADQRLVRLEKLSGEKGFENVLKYAYAAAIDDIARYGGAGKKPRYNIKPPEDPNTFHEKIKDMQRFLSAPTSSKGGIIETYQARAESINKTYGTDFTWQDLADFFQSGDADRIFEAYASQTALRAIGVIQYTKDQLEGRIRSNENVKDDTMTRSMALGIMQRPKFQRTDLRTSMSKETRADIRKELKKGLPQAPKKGKRKR